MKNKMKTEALKLIDNGADIHCLDQVLFLNTNKKITTLSIYSPCNMILVYKSYVMYDLFTSVIYIFQAIKKKKVSPITLTKYTLSLL